MYNIVKTLEPDDMSTIRQKRFATVPVQRSARSCGGASGEAGGGIEGGGLTDGEIEDLSLAARDHCRFTHRRWW